MSCKRVLLFIAVAALLLAVVTAQDPIADIRQNQLGPHAGHHHQSDSGNGIKLGGGAARRLMRWGHYSRARVQASGMYWGARTWGRPSIPNTARVETATERRFAMVGAH